MNQDNKISERYYQYLIHLFDTGTTYDIHEFLVHSELFLKQEVKLGRSSYTTLILETDPEIYKKYQHRTENYSHSIGNKLENIGCCRIDAIEVIPDLSKFQILHNRFTSVVTPWEEINMGQDKLISQLRTATSIIDYQNIGNSSRVLLQNLAKLVFNPTKHIANVNIDLSEGKFKNRLHTFIKSELQESKFKELRNYAESLVTTAEKSVDLTNKTTHDLNAEKIMAEACIISVISVISIIKLLVK